MLSSYRDRTYSVGKKLYFQLDSGSRGHFQLRVFLTSFNKVKSTIGWAWVTLRSLIFIKDCRLVAYQSKIHPYSTMSAFPVSTIEIFGKTKFDTFWSFPYMIALFVHHRLVSDVDRCVCFFIQKKKFVIFLPKIEKFFFWEFFLSVDLNNNFVNF